MKGQLSRGRKKPDDLCCLSEAGKGHLQKVRLRRQQRGEEEMFAGDGGRAGVQATCI